MGFEKLLTCEGVESEALEKTYYEADSVGTGEFEVRRGRKFRVDLDYFLEQNRYGAHGVP